MSKKGNYYEPWPVDFALLELMPNEGLIAGVHWRGRQVKDMVGELNDQLTPDDLRNGAEPFTTPGIQARLRSMAVVGLVTNHPGSGGMRIWARTSKGVDQLGRKNELLGIAEEGPGDNNDYLELGDER